MKEWKLICDGDYEFTSDYEKDFVAYEIHTLDNKAKITAAQSSEAKIWFDDFYEEGVPDNVELVEKVYEGGLSELFKDLAINTPISFESGSVTPCNMLTLSELRYAYYRDSGLPDAPCLGGEYEKYKKEFDEKVSKFIDELFNKENKNI